MSDINTPASTLFHPLTGPRMEETNAGDTRVFIVQPDPNGGDPTELPVPGCIRVTSVRIGNTTLPQKIEYEAPDSVVFTKKLRVALPAYDVSLNYEGVAVLRRNQMSNDGKWQAGQRVYVVGEWEKDDKQDAATSPTGRQKVAA